MFDIKNNYKKNIIKTIALIVTLLLITIGASFAYFTANITGTEDTTTLSVSGGTMNIVYNGGANININNVYPKNEILTTKTFTITGNNTTELDMSYKISLFINDNQFSNGSLKYKLLSINNGGNGTVAKTTTMEDIKTGAQTIILGYGNFTGPTSGNKVHTYNLEIYFPSINESQNENQGKSFTGYIKLELYTIDDNLASLIFTEYGAANEIINAPLGTFEVTSTDTEQSFYKMPDDYGDSYYFRGSINLKNNIIFAEHQWKIVRINGNGSIRIIYNGTCPNNICTINGFGTNQTIGKSVFNNHYLDAKYVGYMYGGAPNVPSTSREQATTNETNSTIKTYLDNWYSLNILNTGYNIKVHDTLFCNDRKIALDGGEGYAKNITNYDTYERIFNSNPTLICENKNDRFTVNDTTIGNGNLFYPIGLITPDEVMIAGYGKLLINSYNYLRINSDWYTMGPSLFNMDENADMFFIENAGLNGGYYDVYTPRGVRPVLNLISTIKVTGEGSIENPYIVK